MHNNKEREKETRASNYLDTQTTSRINDIWGFDVFVCDAIGGVLDVQITMMMMRTFNFRSPL